MTPSELESSRELSQRTSRLRLIAVALLGAVVMFGGYAWLFSPIGSAPLPSTNVLRYSWIAVGVSQMPFLFILRGAMVGRAAMLVRSKPAIADEARIAAAIFEVYRTWVIIALASFESLGLFGGTILLLGGERLDAILVAGPVVGMLAVFPTTGRWRSFDALARQLGQRT